MAYKDDGTPVDEPTQTPDLQSATGQPGGGGSNASLLSLIQGMGAGAGGTPAPPTNTMIPQEAILGLMQGPSFGQRMGAAAAGGVAFMRGVPNPAVAMMEEQRRQQMGIADMMEKMNTQTRLALQWKTTNDRLERAEQRQEAHTKFEEADKIAQRAQAKLIMQDKAYDYMLSVATNPETKAGLAKLKASGVEQMIGAPVPQNVLEGWTRPTPQNRERNDQIIQAFATVGQDPKQIALVAENFNLDPTAVQFYTQALKNPGYRAANGIVDDDVLRGRQVEREIKEKDLLDKNTPRELRGDQPYAMALRGMSQKLFPNRAYESLSDPERARVGDAVHTQHELDAEKKLRLQRELSLQNALSLIDARAGAIQKKPTPYPQIQKALLPYEKGDELITNLALLKEQLKGIPNDALPSGDDWGSQRWAQVQRNLFYSGHQNLTAFMQLWNPVMIGSLDRGYFDEKGARSQQVFQKQLDVVDRLPSRKTMNYLMDTLSDLVQKKMLKDLDTHSKTEGFPPEALDSARSLLAPYAPNAPQVQPPKAAPGLQQRKQFMDMRPQSKNYGKAVWLEYDIGDTIDPRYIPIK